MKEVFEELKNLGFFKIYRPFSIILFSDQVSKRTGAVMEVDSNFEVKLKTKDWEIKIGEEVEFKGNAEKDFEKISEGIAIAKAILYKKIAEEVKNYPVEPSVVWSAYNEALLFGFPEIERIKIGKPVDSKKAFDFPGSYKLGAMFIGNYKERYISDNKKFLKEVLDQISNFFSNYDKLAYGKIEGETDKFRIMTLALAKKGDFIAQRVYVALLNGMKIKYTDFKYLNEKFKLNVNFIRDDY